MLYTYSPNTNAYIVKKGILQTDLLDHEKLQSARQILAELLGYGGKDDYKLLYTAIYEIKERETALITLPSSLEEPLPSWQNIESKRSYAFYLTNYVPLLSSL